MNTVVRLLIPLTLFWCVVTSSSVLDPLLGGPGTTKTDSDKDDSKSKTLEQKVFIKEIDFAFKCPGDREKAIASGEFIPGNPYILDIQPYYNKKGGFDLFVVLPRNRLGVPATLGKVDMGNPSKIIPYPNLESFQNSSACLANRIVSASRMKLVGDVLWVLDYGVINGIRLCSPQIVAFNLIDNSVFYRTNIPDSVLVCQSFLLGIEVEVTSNTTFVYIADAQGNTIIVHDVAGKTFWKMSSLQMYPDPDDGVFAIAGIQLRLMVGIVNMVNAPSGVMYFRSLSSRTENKVNTVDLHNVNQANNSDIFFTFPKRRSTQASGTSISKTGVQFFGSLGDTALKCWNTALDFDEANFKILAQDADLYHYVSSVKIIYNPIAKKDELWCLSNKFDLYILGIMDPTKNNFIISSGDVDKLISGTICQPK